MIAAAEIAGGVEAAAPHDLGGKGVGEHDVIDRGQTIRQQFVVAAAEFMNQTCPAHESPDSIFQLGHSVDEITAVKRESDHHAHSSKSSRVSSCVSASSRLPG